MYSGEQLQQSSDATFAALVAVCAELTQAVPQKQAALITATWSQVHGFAMLAINGQLAMIEPVVGIRDMLHLTWRKIAQRMAEDVASLG